MKFIPYDPAEGLDSDEAIEIFMTDAFETKDAAYIAHAMGVVARARGMAKIAKRTGFSREQLDRSFGEDWSPTLKAMISVMDALGLDLTAKVHV